MVARGATKKLSGAGRDAAVRMASCAFRRCALVDPVPMEGSAGSGPQTTTTVSLADAAVAAAIARAAASGRTADRTPTIEQLLAAFGEGEPTIQARARAAAAMRLAGVVVSPDIHSASPGSRLTLTAPGAPRRRPMLVTLLLALVAIAIVTGTAFGVSRLLSGKDKRAAQDLPATTPLTISSATTTAETATTPAETTTADTATAATPTTTTPTATERRAARRRADERRAAALARRPMVVTLDATARPTFLCVDDGAGGELFNGTLAGRRTFRGVHIRLNIGLASTRVTVNGNELTLPGSPSGFDVSRKNGIRPLPLGRRPCA